MKFYAPKYKQLDLGLLRKGYSIRDVANNWGNSKTKPASCGNASTFVVDLKYLRLP